MRRRTFLAGAALSGAARGVSGELLLVTRAEAGRLKAPARLGREARKAMALGPWSVTTERPGALSKAGLHDFFSEGPYWWPDPAKPGGPYVRRDGEVNPERFTANDRDLSQMADAALKLALAAYFLKDAAAAERAWKVLAVWFLDEATRMTPHLEYGQAIRGVTEGRGVGIIDSRPLVWCAQAAMLLEASFPKAAAAGLKAWFAEYVKWLTGSKKGTDERKQGNNHSSWWAAQVAAYAIYCGDERAEQEAYALYRDELVGKHLRADGSAPAEEARTRSLSYSVFNLDALSMLCRLAEVRGVSLWGYQTKEGAGVLKSTEYVAGYLAAPEKWTKPQITGVEKIRCHFPALVGRGAGRKDLVELQKRLGLPGGGWGLMLEMLMAGWV